MSNQLLSSKVVVLEEPPQIASVQALPTAILAMVGITERGPFEPQLCTSYEQWRKLYGGYTADSLNTAAAVQGYFEEGGQFLWFHRVVHYTDIADAGTRASADAATAAIQTAAAAASAGTVLGSIVGPYSLANGATLTLSVDGGANDTATFNATAGARDTGNAPFALTDGWTLQIAVDGGATQTVTFNTSEFVAIGAATAAEVAAVINAETTGLHANVSGSEVIITSDRLGTGSSIQIVGGTAAAALTLAGTGTGTGDASDSTAVTVAELITLIEGDIAGVNVTDDAGAVRITSLTTGGASSVQVIASSTMDSTLGFDNATHSGSSGAAVDTLRFDGKTDGEYANDLSILIRAATSGESDKFDVVVLRDGVTIEVWPNCSMDDESDDYVETKVNADGVGSDLVAAVDLDADIGSALQDRPANGTYGMSGGDDGLASIADTDFVGSSVSHLGLRSFDDVDGITLLACPARPTAAVANALITYAEVTRDGSMLALIDTPAQETAAQAITYVETTAAILGLSEFGAVFWPHVKVLNPNTAVLGNAETVTVPPTGHVAGVIARTDSSRPGGVFIPAANANGQLRSIVGFETLPGRDRPESFNEANRDLVYPKRINPLDAEGPGRVIDGVRTLRADGNFPSISERRAAIFIEQTLKTALKRYKNRNNDAQLRAEVTRLCEKFLTDQMRLGAFRSQNPATAFFVDFGEGLNPASVQFAGQLVGRIGLATQKPAEFIVLKFTQDVRALEQELAG